MTRILRARELSNHKAQAGFTLFELLVVITIMAILLGLSVPSLNMDSGRGAFAGFEKALRGGVSDARYLSMITGKAQRLMISDDGKIKVLPSGVETLSFSDEISLLSIEKASGKTENNFVINFYPSGLAESCALQVSKGDVEQTFYVQPVTGMKSESGAISLSEFQK